MVLNLRQSLAREPLKLQVAAVRNLLSEQSCICLLILDLSVYIAVERTAVVRLEREKHRVVSAMQQRV